jgi:hypothetical protein
LCFGPALICMTYCIAFLFGSSNTAFRSLGILYVIVGWAVPITVTTVLSSVKSIPDSVSSIVTGIFYIDPFYPFYQSLIYLSIQYGPNGLPVSDSTLDLFFPGFLPETSYSCAAMLGMAVIFFFLAVFIDYKKSKSYRK